LCPLEHGFDRLLAGTAAHSGQVTQLFQLLRVEVGHDGALEERLNYLRFIVSGLLTAPCGGFDKSADVDRFNGIGSHIWSTIYLTVRGSEAV
jgi:hypothetical protein